MNIDKSKNSSEWIFLKNNVSENDYFAELCEHVAKKFGNCSVHSATNSWKPKKHIKFSNGPFYVKSNIYTKFFSWVKYFLASLIFLIKEKKTNLFIVNSPPFLSILGYFYKKLYGFNYIVWVDDIYPEILFSKNIISKNSLISFFWIRMNKIIYKNATEIITISPLMKKQLSTYFAEDINKITVIPTWVNTNEIKPIKKEKNIFAKKYNQIDKITIMYSGNFGATHDTLTLVMVAKALQKIVDINFFFIGEGEDFEKLKKEYTSLENTYFLPWQSRENLKYSLSCADVGLVTLEKGIGHLSMPSKTYYYMAAGAAIIGVSESSSSLASLIKRYKFGFNLIPKDIEKIVEKIIFYKKNKDILIKHQKTSRSFSLNSVSKEVCLKRVLKVMKKNN